MDALIIVCGIVFSYFVFISLAVVLAKLIFPKIELEDDDLISASFVSAKKKVRSAPKVDYLKTLSKRTKAPSGFGVSYLKS